MAKIIAECVNLIQTWKIAIDSPPKLLKNKGSITEGSKHIILSGTIVGILATILYGPILFGPNPGIFLLLSTWLFAGPIAALVTWASLSFVTYIFARILGGKGQLTLHAYFIAIYTSSFLLLSTILGYAPLIGKVLAGLIWLYGLFLMVSILEKVHKYSRVKSAASLIMGVLLLILLVIFNASLL